MKKSYFMGYLPLLVFALCLGFVSCGGDDDDNGGNSLDTKLVDTWIYLNKSNGTTKTVTFTNDGKFYLVTETLNNTSSTTGTFKTQSAGNSKTVTMVINSINTIYTYTLSGDNLTLKPTGEEAEEYVRKSSANMSLVGTWMVSIDDNILTATFTSDNKFTIQRLNDGDQTTYTGTYNAATSHSIYLNFDNGTTSVGSYTVVGTRLYTKVTIGDVTIDKTWTRL